MNIAPLLTSKTPEWPTPQWFYDALNAEFGFNLDPCCTPLSAKCETFYTKEHDGLEQDWSAHRVFMNPPYGREIAAWMEKAHMESKRGALVVCLVPARTDTAWWHDYAMPHEIRLLKGRLKFGNAEHSAPFPSAVVVMRPAAHRLK